MVGDGLEGAALVLGQVLAEVFGASGVLDLDLFAAGVLGHAAEVAVDSLGLLGRLGAGNLGVCATGRLHAGVAAPLAEGTQLGLGELVVLLGPGGVALVGVAGDDIRLAGDAVPFGDLRDQVLVEPGQRRLLQFAVRGPVDGEAEAVVLLGCRMRVAHLARGGVVDGDLTARLGADGLHAQPVELRRLLVNAGGDAVGHVDGVGDEGHRRKGHARLVGLGSESCSGDGVQPERGV